MDEAVNMHNCKRLMSDPSALCICMKCKCSGGGFPALLEQYGRGGLVFMGRLPQTFDLADVEFSSCPPGVKEYMKSLGDYGSDTMKDVVIYCTLECVKYGVAVTVSAGARVEGGPSVQAVRSSSLESRRNEARF